MFIIEQASSFRRSKMVKKQASYGEMYCQTNRPLTYFFKVLTLAYS